jgi:hypothetical protein
MIAGLLNWLQAAKIVKGKSFGFHGFDQGHAGDNYSTPDSVI